MASFWAVLLLGFWLWFGFVAVLLQVLVRYLGPHSGTQVPILVWLMAWLFAMFLGRSLFGRRSAFRDPGPHLFRDLGQALFRFSSTWLFALFFCRILHGTQVCIQGPRFVFRLGF